MAPIKCLGRERLLNNIGMDRAKSGVCQGHEPENGDKWTVQASAACVHVAGAGNIFEDGFFEIAKCRGDNWGPAGVRVMVVRRHDAILSSSPLNYLCEISPF